jgi:hypothetical protein
MADVLSRALLGVAVSAGGLVVSTTASAVTINGLEGSGFAHIHGSYAPGGDCSREPRVTLDDAGMTFHAIGRTVQRTRVEYAASFFGMSHEGIALAFFPFTRNDNDMGAVLMIVNEDEKPGAIRIESNAEPGQRLDPFEAALAGSYQLCPGTGSGVAPPQAAEPQRFAGTPLEWTNLRALVGRYPGTYAEDNIDLFEQGAIAAALRSLLGGKMEVLKTNLSTVGPLERRGNYYYIYGNAPHRGGEDQAYVLIDGARRTVQVGLWEQGKLTVYAPASGRLPVPPDIQRFLDNSPGETANAAPGTPWEVLPVQGRAPAAYVEPAASPSITSLSLYCENGRPYMAILLGKPAAGTRMTFTWNFAGRLVNIPLQRANNAGTYWVGGVADTPLLQHLMTQSDAVNLRIDGRLEGEASLAKAPEVLRATMRGCVQL